MFFPAHRIIQSSDSTSLHSKEGRGELDKSIDGCGAPPDDEK